jgi:hypothetical protein
MASKKPYRSIGAKTELLQDAGQAVAFNRSRLRSENQAFQRTGGISSENRDRGFKPAFLDTATGHTYRSCFANGREAPVHILDGLPDEIVVARSSSGRVFCAKPSIRAGFLRKGRFYSREEVVRTLTDSREAQ